MRGARGLHHRRADLLGIIPAYAGSTESAPSLMLLGPGSSPRMRGAPAHRAVHRPPARIIPAYAGSTPSPGRRRSAGEDHPRVCGEHGESGASLRAAGGSSPRMRGAPLRQFQNTYGLRIIPAYAGSTSSSTSSAPRCGDHPRVCGEHPFVPNRASMRLGSSPRMRGAPPGSGGTGSTWWDHPRVCGEHCAAGGEALMDTGSSPRMRGALDCLRIPGRFLRIIPAYAGSTDLDAARARSRRDHPRVCGEHLSDFGIKAYSPGSSPRMRGAHVPSFCAGDWDGIIPAYAGSTRWPSRP